MIASVVSVSLGACVGCSGVQSALDTAGPRAERVSGLWWLLFWVSVAVWVVSTGMLIYALLRRRSDSAPLTDTFLNRLVLWSGAIVPAVVLIGLLIFALRTTRALANPDVTPKVVIEVTGRQWWWRVKYLQSDDSQPTNAGDQRSVVETANEIHIPVGEPVLLRLKSDDVIHSFWVPSLAGKMDTIPGKTNKLWIVADRAGSFRGQCAEYCGAQHANMAFVVIAESRQEFDQWLEHQRQPAAAPETPVAVRGRDVFLNNQCAKCHVIRGHDSTAGDGPDLTHFASRRTIAAGTIPNTEGHLGGWIGNPQTIKPGNKMPYVPLEAEDFTDLLVYLETLR
tara:strand:- start:12464 stop:13477 length:1014 start_codon:yes stop_codon:yes gene_type:complete